MSAKWWPDAGADLSNLGALHSRDRALCVFILCIPAGAAQNRAVSWLSPALPWCQGELCHWFQRQHSWSLKYERGKKSRLNFLRNSKENSILKIQSYSVCNHKFLRGWKIGGIGLSLKKFLYQNPKWLILLVSRSQRCIFQADRKTASSWSKWIKPREICCFLMRMP